MFRSLQGPGRLGGRPGAADRGPSPPEAPEEREKRRVSGALVDALALARRPGELVDGLIDLEPGGDGGALDGVVAQP